MPSVQVMPTFLPVSRRIRAIRRVTVVLPLTPVTPTVGIRPFSAAGKEGLDDRLARPACEALEGGKCGRRPGPEWTATTTPSCSSSGRLRSTRHDVDARHVEPDDPRRVLGRAATSG